MPKLTLCRLLRDTNYFKKGQKVWVVFFTGALAYKVIGRFRGKGRWVLGWISIQTPPEYQYGHKNPTAEWVDEVEVTEKFYEYYVKIVAKIVKSDYWNTHG